MLTIAKPQQEDNIDSGSRPDWLWALLRIAAHYRIGTSPEQLRREADWTADRDQLARLCRSAGMQMAPVGTNLDSFVPMRLPVLVELKTGRLGVVESQTADGFMVALSDDAGLATAMARELLQDQIHRAYALRPLSTVPDSRVDDYIAPWRADWLRRILFADLRPYRAIMIASVATNLLALAGIIFSMQVYDRVVPSQSLPTLNVLFGAVMVATVFGYLMKVLRGRITDKVGKIADNIISDRVFGHALRVRSLSRPRATGTFIAQIRELEHVREMMASTTVAAIADVPFFLLFTLLFFYIAGPLVWIPLVAAVLLVVPGLLAQGRLRRLAEMSMRESALRGAMLVEAVQGIDDIKTLQAEARFQNLWNHCNEVTGNTTIEQRDLVNRLSAWAQSLQGAVFTLVIYFGAPQVMAGEMSTGVLVAGSMLSSRMIAPLASVTQIINRWQQAKISRQALNRLMALPVDAPDNERRIHMPALRGALALKNVQFGHDPEHPALKIEELTFAPGERVAILGRNGSGKSTLLAGLSGLLSPLSGDMRVDNITVGLIDPADLRRDIAYLGQNARLFHATLRENLTLGAAQTPDREIMAVLDQLLLGDAIRKLADGLDHMIHEGGMGLSGGQRQGLLLARLLLRNPQLLLLDEPTASLDEVAEAALIDALMRLERDRSVIIATHRRAVLRMVDRLIVLNNGTIAMDGPRDSVLAALRERKAAA